MIINLKTGENIFVGITTGITVGIGGKKVTTTLKYFTSNSMIAPVCTTSSFLNSSGQELSVESNEYISQGEGGTVTFGGALYQIDGNIFATDTVNSVTVPESVGVMNSAFTDCSEINEINFLGAAPVTNATCFSGISASTKICYNKDYDYSSIKEKITGCIESFEGFVTMTFRAGAANPSYCLGHSAMTNCYDYYMLPGDNTHYPVTQYIDYTGGSENFVIYFHIADITNRDCLKAAHSGSTNVIKAVICEGVTKIGSSFCANNPYLEEVVLPEGITTIADNSFNTVSKSTSAGLKINIPSSVIEIGSGTAGKSFNASKIASGFTLNNVKRLRVKSFAGTQFVSSALTIPETVTEITGTSVFSGSNIVTLTIAANADNLVVNDSNWALMMKQLRRIVYPEGVTSNIGVVGTTTTGVTSVSLPSTLTTLNQIVYRNTTITGITLPEGLEVIGSSAFLTCSKLTGITIPNSVTSIGSSAFQNCSSLTVCIIGTGVTSIGSYAFRNCTALSSINIPEGVTEIGERAFANCAFTSITIPASVERMGNKTLPIALIEATAYSLPQNVFNGCTSLTSVTIGDNVTQIGIGAFEGCTALSAITIPANVTYIGIGAFKDCTALSAITIPANVTDIGYNSFFNCAALNTINYDGTKAQWGAIIKGENWSTSVPTRFVHCTDGDVNISDYYIINYSGTSKVYPNPVPWAELDKSVWDETTGAGIFVFNSSAITIPINVFTGNTFLTGIDLQNAECNINSIEYYAFRYCSNLANVTLPSNLKTLGTGVFGQCSSLTAITLPQTLRTIMGGAFSEADLHSVSIPVSVTSIGNNAFKYNYNLNTFNYEGTMAQWANVTASGTWHLDCPFTVVHCTDGDVPI